MNSITLCGNIGQEPTMEVTKSGQSVCKFSIADQLPKDKEGNEQTQWFNCRAYGRVAELVHEYFGKGHPIFVYGRLHVRTYEKSDGSKGTSSDVTVTGFDFVPFGSKRKEDDPAEPTPPTPRPATASAPAATNDTFDVPDITDPFADQ